MKTTVTLAAMLLASSTLGLRGELPGYLAKAFETQRWVAYSPTGPSSSPTNETIIREDLQTLARAGFTGIVTYGCDGMKKQIPRLAREAGIPHVVLGIYNPTNREEMENAKALATLVDGYCVGNEGLLEKPPRYTIDDLRTAMEEIKHWTSRPVSTSEQIDNYYDEKIGATLLELGDWLFPNVHPYWHGKQAQPGAAEWTRDEVEKLKVKAKNKPIICKEVGLPTGSEDAEIKSPDQQAQADYYAALRAFRVPFVYFEAFDQVWKKRPPVEPFWGLFDKDRKPKLVVSQLGQITPSVGIVGLQDGGKIVVRRTANGGFFEVRGTVTGLGANRELLLFVNTGDPAAAGWFLQIEPNGITDIDNDKWVAQGQIGNTLYPPRPDQRIHLRILAVAKADAKRLKEERASNEQLRNSGIYSQDLPQTDAQWRADVRDLELVIQPSNR